MAGPGPWGRAPQAAASILSWGGGRGGLRRGGVRASQSGDRGCGLPRTAVSRPDVTAWPGPPAGAGARAGAGRSPTRRQQGSRQLQRRGGAVPVGAAV